MKRPHVFVRRAIVWNKELEYANEYYFIKIKESDFCWQQYDLVLEDQWSKWNYNHGYTNT